MRSHIMTLFRVLMILVAAIPAVASGLVDRDQIAPSSTLPPCAQVSVFIADNYHNRTPPYSVPPVLAHDCLLSVPLNTTSAKIILSEIPLYLDWQSTLDVLKQPPAEYVEKIQEPVDILAGLESISKDIDNGTITGDYEFGQRLYQLFTAAHDGHLMYVLDVFGVVFSFTRPLPLVSISEDGIKLPAVFVYDDILHAQFKNITYTPSPIKKIDSFDVNDYLENLSQIDASQDRDARYNGLFYNLAQISLKSSGFGTGLFSGGGDAQLMPLPAETTIDFVNGSALVIQNIAETYADFTKITSGELLAKLLMSVDDSPRKTSVPGATEAENPVGYPAPVVAGPYNMINGFYIDDPGYRDVAVLAVPSFVYDNNSTQAFQAAGKKFLEKAWKEGKTKLIVDLQANGGGKLLEVYDLFRQIFPDSDPYSGSRWRFNEAFDFVGQTFSDFATQYPPDAGLTNATLESIWGSFLNYHEDLNAEGCPFKSWKEKAGPYNVNGSNYGAIAQADLTSIYMPYYGSINVTGRSNNSRWTAENVVLVTDGFCASACAHFTELMTQEFGVKTVALGGRSNANKMQAVGGVKGTLFSEWSTIQDYVKTAIRLNGTVPDPKLKGYTVSHAIYRGWAYGLNVRDGVRKNDDSGVALQFKYEESDCRLYYTAEMTVNASAIWKTVVDTHWGDRFKCIGNGDYYASYDRRANQDKTTSLRPAPGHMHGAEARNQFQALKSTFSIRTKKQQPFDGFMQP